MGFEKRQRRHFIALVSECTSWLLTTTAQGHHLNLPLGNRTKHHLHIHNTCFIVLSSSISVGRGRFISVFHSETKFYYASREVKSICHWSHLHNWSGVGLVLHKSRIYFHQLTYLELDVYNMNYEANGRSTKHIDSPTQALLWILIIRVLVRVRVTHLESWWYLNQPNSYPIFEWLTKDFAVAIVWQRACKWCQFVAISLLVYTWTYISTLITCHHDSIRIDLSIFGQIGLPVTDRINRSKFTPLWTKLRY